MGRLVLDASAHVLFISYKQTTYMAPFLSYQFVCNVIFHFRSDYIEHFIKTHRTTLWDLPRFPFCPLSWIISLQSVQLITFNASLRVATNICSQKSMTRESFSSPSVSIRPYMWCSRIIILQSYICYSCIARSSSAIQLLCVTKCSGSTKYLILSSLCVPRVTRRPSLCIILNVVVGICNAYGSRIHAIFIVYGLPSVPVLPSVHAL